MWDFTNDEQGKNSFALLPKGEYNAIVDSFKERKTNSGNDQMLLTFIITDGDHKGRKITKGYLMSGNEKAVQIARGQLKTLLACAQKGFDLKGPWEFVGLEICLGIKIAPNHEGQEVNEVSYTKPKKNTYSSESVPF
jgi:hypothetical protein